MIAADRVAFLKRGGGEELPRFTLFATLRSKDFVYFVPVSRDGKTVLLVIVDVFSSFADLFRDVCVCVGG